MLDTQKTKKEDSALSRFSRKWSLRACPLVALFAAILIFCPDFSDSDSKIIPPVGRD
jgi:hypothetical protein